MMRKINWKDHGQVLAVASILITILSSIVGLVVSAEEFRDFVAEYWAYWLLVIALLLSLSWGVSLRHKILLLREKSDVTLFRRFEQLRGIRYGHVRYYPFMDYTKPRNEPTGVGLRVLEELFGPGVLVAHRDGSTWANVIDRLVQGDFDIIATPLFETRERSRKVAFSSPMFFADIGVYVRKPLANEKQSFTLNEMKDRLVVLSTRFHAEVIVGEISEKMVKKYLRIPNKRVTRLPPEEVQISNLFQNLVAHDRSGDIVFAERLFAEFLPEVQEGKVVNILKPKELLYPWGFAMRKQDNVLRHYINIKLMELDDKHPKRLLGFIVEEVRNHPGFDWVTEDNASEYFVREK